MIQQYQMLCRSQTPLYLKRGNGKRLEGRTVFDWWEQKADDRTLCQLFIILDHICEWKKNLSGFFFEVDKSDSKFIWKNEEVVTEEQSENSHQILKRIFSFSH